MKMKFEAVDKIAIDNLGPMGPYEYIFVACGDLAINKDQHGNIQVEVGDGQTVYGDDIRLELTDGCAHLLVWMGCKVTAVFFGYYDGDAGVE